jgi:hypothetical protein
LVKGAGSPSSTMAEEEVLMGWGAVSADMVDEVMGRVE